MAHRYTIEQDNWLRENRPQNKLVDVVKMFNERYGTNISYGSLKSHCLKALHICGDVEDRNEKDAFLREYYPTHSSKETCEEYIKRFDENIKLGTLVNYCNRVLKLTTRDTYSEEQKEWLREYFPYHSINETQREFNRIFGTNIKTHTLHGYCNKNLGLTRMGYRFSKEEIEWIKKYYPINETIDETYRKFVKRFGELHSRDTLVAEAWRLGVSKRFWTKEEEQWLLEHYRDYSKSTKDIYKEFCIAFPERKTFAAFESYAKAKLGLGTSGRGRYKEGNENYRTKKRKELGINDDNVILSDLGNGEYIEIDKKLYKDMTRKGSWLGKGEITKTMLEVYRVKDAMNKIKRER